MASPSAAEQWKRFARHLYRCEPIGLTLDISRMGFPGAFLSNMKPAIQRALRAMRSLEQGALANPDENRQVGHYWLRAPHLAPSKEIRDAIESMQQQVRTFAADVHAARIRPATAPRLSRVLVIGIGGSALGPQFVSDALSQGDADRMQLHFIDNTDPDGIARVLSHLRPHLAETLAIVISKSGGTPETRNGMLHAAAAWRSAGFDFPRHAVAITQAGSALDNQAAAEHWLARFPMWDWVGGRYSQTSAVGLLPAALQGIDIDALLQGAAECDQATRGGLAQNPAALLALMWYFATGGRGKRDMVVLPYKDRLLLFSRYLQQLIMESLGKERDLDGKKVHQGITVYGNKGSTDQHAYVQQLRDGVNNFFVTFIRVLEGGGEALEVQPEITAADYLHGFLLGTRQALFENGRSSLTITIPRVDAYGVGVLIALFERAVGLYASLVNINAYHQPGVEAGKKAADAVLRLQTAVLAVLAHTPRTAEDIAAAAGEPDQAETVYLLLEHLAANGRAQLVEPGAPKKAKFARAGSFAPASGEH